MRATTRITWLPLLLSLSEYYFIQSCMYTCDGSHQTQGVRVMAAVGTLCAFYPAGTWPLLSGMCKVCLHHQLQDCLRLFQGVKTAEVSLCSSSITLKLVKDKSRLREAATGAHRRLFITHGGRSFQMLENHEKTPL